MPKESLYSAVLSILFFCAAILHLTYVFFPYPWLKLSYSLLCAILLVSAFFSIGWSTRIMALILIVIGSFIFIHYDISLATIIDSFGQNMNVLTLFLFVPLFGLIMSEGGYLNALKGYITHHEHLARRPYRLSNMLTVCMGMFLNLGTVPIIYHIARESFSAFYSKKMAMVIQRGFGFCAFWSPYFVNVGLVISLFEVNWSNLVWAGLGVGFVYFLLALLFNRWLRFDGDQQIGKPSFHPETAGSAQSYGRKTGALALWVAGLFLLSMTLDHFLPISMLTIVSLLALAYPVIWSAAIRSLPGYIQSARTELSRSYIRLKNELTIFISAGFFGVAVSHTPLGTVISEWILTLSLGSVYVMSVLVLLMTIIFALLGIHPVIVLIGIGSSFHPDLFGVSPVYMAVLMLIAWTLATQLSPFSGSVLITASLINTSPWLLMRKNLPFIAVLLFVLPLALYLLFFMFS